MVGEDNRSKFIVAMTVRVIALVALILIPLLTGLALNMITSGEITIEHLFEARMLIEPRIARDAALHASREDLRKVCDLLKDSKAHLDDPVRLKQNNLSFHLLLARASGNPVLSIMLESVIELLVERILDFVDLSLERHFLEIHQEILQVIVDKKPDEAEKLIKADIQNVGQKISDFKKSH